mmetsp:Transcript_17610/g.61974  ORF Transcript_17610/g.61974 Transcript_17610/m.61974 type:complete len:266 (-) Transcript_17610:222-1019(-)
MNVRSSRTSFSPCDPTTIISSSSSSASSSWKMLIVSFCCSACSHSGATASRNPVISGRVSSSTAFFGTAIASLCTLEFTGRNHVVCVATGAVPDRAPGHACRPTLSSLRVSSNAGLRCWRKSAAFCSPPSLSENVTRLPNSRRRRTISHCFSGRLRLALRPDTSDSVSADDLLSYALAIIGFSSYTTLSAASSSAAAAAAAASAAAFASSASRSTALIFSISLSKDAAVRQITQFWPYTSSRSAITSSSSRGYLPIASRKPWKSE